MTTDGACDTLRLVSPTTGLALTSDGDALLTDGVETWPVLHGIPYLRIGREDVRNEAVERIRSGDREGALVLLLADRRDDLIPPADFEEIRELTLPAATLGDAMRGLNYGAMEPYITHRFSLPTYLSGLSLLSLHAPVRGTLFELGCGAGHFLHAWSVRGPSIGADLVFSYLWLARRFTSPASHLVCFDATGPFPILARAADVVLCHDALHYLADIPHAVCELCRVCPDGPMLCGHVHNAAVESVSFGKPLSLKEYRRLLCPDASYDDNELVVAALHGPGYSICANADTTTKAFAFASGCGGEFGATIRAESDLTIAPRGSRLSLNPLFTRGALTGVGRKFIEEFVHDWDYLRDPGASREWLPHDLLANNSNLHAERRRLLLRLPEAWR